MVLQANCLQDHFGYRSIKKLVRRESRSTYWCLHHFDIDSLERADLGEVSADAYKE